MDQLSNGSPALPQVRRGRASETDALAGVLARAFADDPVFEYCLRRDAQRNAARLAYFQIALRVVMARGEVWTMDDLSGACLFLAPGVDLIDQWVDLRWVPQLLRCTSLAGALPALRALQAFIRASPETPHYYLFLLAVEPTRQGQGLGAALLEPMLTCCRQQRYPAYLESTNPAHRGFYERHGFRATRELTLGRNAPTATAMWRDAPQPVRVHGYQ